MLLDFGGRAAQVEKEWFRAEKRKKKTGNILFKIRIKCFFLSFNEIVAGWEESLLVHFLRVLKIFDNNILF